MRAPLLVIAFLITGTALAGARGPAASGQAPASPGVQPAPPQIGVGGPEAYRLEPGDEIEIKYFYNQELNDTVRIRPDGHISLPLFGQLRVSGMSIYELTVRLQEIYRDIVKQPAITVQVRDYANRRIFVGGEVTRPAVQELQGRQTALAAIMEAGGFTREAKRNEVTVIRRSAAGTPERIRLTLKDTPGELPQAATFELQPLDVVVVTESGIARANRAVDQYVRQLLPVAVSFGFTYLVQGQFLGVR